MLLNGMFAFRKTIVQIKGIPIQARNPLQTSNLLRILSTYTNMFHLRPLFKFLVYLIFLCLIDCISLDILS